MSYAIDVSRIPIRLRTLRGEDIDAAVFVHPVGHADFRPESVGDRLNDPDTRFLPCTIDGESQLVRLSSISYVLMTEPVPEVESLEAVGATRCPAESAASTEPAKLPEISELLDALITRSGSDLHLSSKQ